MSTPSKLPGTGLEDVRIPGQTFLRDALTSCTDPLKAIETFQASIFSENFVFVRLQNRILSAYKKLQI